MDSSAWLTWRSNQVYWEVRNREKAEDVAINEWKEIMLNPGQRFKRWEGSGASLRVWQDVGRTMFEDRKRFENTAFMEGTKANKNIVSQQDTMEALRTHASAAASSVSFGSAHMQHTSPVQVKSKRPAPLEEARLSPAKDPTQGMKRKLDVLQVAPAKHKVCKKQLKALAEGMKATCSLTEEALELHSRFHDSEDKVQHLLAQGVRARYAVVKWIMAEDMTGKGIELSEPEAKANKIQEESRILLNIAAAKAVVAAPVVAPPQPPEPPPHDGLKEEDTTEAKGESESQAQAGAEAQGEEDDGKEVTPAAAHPQTVTPSSSSSAAGCGSLGEQLTARVKQAFADGRHHTNTLTHKPEHVMSYLQMSGLLEALTEAQSFEQHAEIASALDNAIEACKTVRGLALRELLPLSDCPLSRSNQSERSITISCHRRQRTTDDRSCVGYGCVVASDGNGQWPTLASSPRRYQGNSHIPIE